MGFYRYAYYVALLDAKGVEILAVQSAELAQRIVACVNACRHLEPEYLEWLSSQDRFLVGSSIKSTAASIAAYEKLVADKSTTELAAAASRAMDQLLKEYGGIDG